MTPRQAYEALFCGRLSRDYGPAWAPLIRRVLACDFDALVREGRIASPDEETLRAATSYADALAPRLVNGIEVFDSIYDLLLFHERLAYNWDYSRERPLPTVYRGQFDSSWTLVPSLFREWGALDVHMKRVIRGASRLLRSLDQADSLSAWQLLAVLQHYGFRTCLMDFTTSLRIAAFFACRRTAGESPAEYGAIYKLSKADYEDLVPPIFSALGHLFLISTPGIPRIDLQAAVFAGGQKPPALEMITASTRYFFRHNSDSSDFAESVGLSDVILFPAEDHLAAKLASVEEDTKALGLSSPLAQIQGALEYSVIQAREPLRWRDYFDVARLWVAWHAVPEERKREVEILCRWFEKIQGLALPAICRSLHMLQIGVETLMIDPWVQADSCTDIDGRMVAMGWPPERVERQHQDLSCLFAEARLEAGAASLQPG